ncbi:MAG: hypothetical protein ACK528_03005, partial [Alphaproteobacteria bacterium]
FLTFLLRNFVPSDCRPKHNGLSKKNRASLGSQPVGARVVSKVNKQKIGFPKKDFNILLKTQAEKNLICRKSTNSARNGRRQKHRKNRSFAFFDGSKPIFGRTPGHVRQRYRRLFGHRDGARYLLPMEVKIARVFGRRGGC